LAGNPVGCDAKSRHPELVAKPDVAFLLALPFSQAFTQGSVISIASIAKPFPR
jgi:hypothetical protein